ncbi:SDR family NAD(P)-dependent oxidoreductase [Azospirillum sp. TSA6c]|uniref:SDR family NAD(P)-dependent oxidoreductase n=1 Tax=unclassified Azospirillum TaxID=2630922 RepID=UPI0020004A3E|nr:SDR family NAD(P)-dependent oxidoreductase [Azospirillum sp. TSA6c]
MDGAGGDMGKGSDGGSQGVTWITGAGSGIGRALAIHLANAGARVALSARTVEDLTAAVQMLPDRMHMFPLDVTDRKATAATVAAIESRLGPIDRAVLNAGTHSPMSLEDFSADTARRLMEVNYMGVVHGLEALLPRMRARGRGQLAVVASVAGYRGLPTAAAYGPTKAALINLCESLKPDCDRAGIKLQLVCPGFIDTPLTACNRFRMPDLMPVEDAARELADGLDGNRFEIAFPRRFTRKLKLARCLPYRLYFPLVRKATGA